jgi:hypothetical protein
MRFPGILLIALDFQAEISLGKDKANEYQLVVVLLFLE